MASAKSAPALKLVASNSKTSAIDAAILDAASAARLMEATLLRPETTREQVLAMCEEAQRLGFASVCVNPFHVPAAVSRLRGSGVKVATVIAFPFGATLTTVKRFEASEAMRAGATELEMAINLGALRSGDYDHVRSDIHAVADICGSGGAVLKVIVETGLLTQSEKSVACELALAAGAHVVQTSSGLGPNGATPEDVHLMRRVVGTRMGVNACGEIRTLQHFRAVVAAGASRVGTASGPQILAALA